MFPLTEYGAFWKCVQVGGMYLLVQLCKMLLLATFFPTLDGPLEASGLLTELVKTTVDFGDVMGMSVVLSRVPGAGHIKVLITGLGWAAADLLLTRALPLWVGARGLEFDWKYIQISLDANISLVHHLNLALLVWLWWRVDLAPPVRPIAAVLLAGCVYRPLLPQVLTLLMGSQPAGFTLLAANATTTLCTALIASHTKAWWLSKEEATTWRHSALKKMVKEVVEAVKAAEDKKISVCCGVVPAVCM
ncbi:Transmembrane protein 147 [Portunus trituberculatus]|uniref:BOS complex subunit TMEM147 n=1 Tax=Portunus trituberculatus TaxID=210409 RepID=A0A5B7D6L7_PORTR|nr:Transmembrane protein 147 [Portunus trituberculatus]